MRKKYLLIGLLFIAIGFASVTTTLVINGTSTIKKKDDAFKVYYSDALVNGAQDLSVVVDDTHLSFKTTLDTLGQTYVLDYDVTNSSKQYDAQLTMNCTGGNEYLTVVNTFNTADNLLATDTRRGKLTLTLAKSYSGADMDVEIVCTLGANAVERDSEGTGTPKDPVQGIDEGQEFCKNKGYAYGMLSVNTYNSNDYEQPLVDEYYLCSNSEEFEEYHGYDSDGNLITVNGFAVTEAETFCIGKGYAYGMDFIMTYQGADQDEYYPSYVCTNDVDYNVYDYYAADGTLIYSYTGGIDHFRPED